jgi:hypothetical protein
MQVTKRVVFFAGKDFHETLKMKRKGEKVNLQRKKRSFFAENISKETKRRKKLT